MDNIADILGQMAVQLWERMLFDFRKCTDLAKLYGPVVNRDAIYNTFVHQLSNGSRGYVAKATMQVHEGDC